MSNASWQEKYAEIVYEHGHVEFFERVFNSCGVTKLVIISPWIVSNFDDPVPLENILNHIKKHNIETTIVMRSPQKEPNNFQAVDLIKHEIKSLVTLYFNNSVHAKIYVCRCQPFGFALLSSANLTPHASRIIEVGIIVNGFGEGKKLVEELELTGTDYIPHKNESSLEWAPYFNN